MSVFVFDEKNFDSEVLSSDKTVLVDFWATWCGPCRMMAPVVEDLAQSHPELKVGKVNVDEAPALAQRYGVSSIPTLMIFQGGEAVETTVGYQPKESIEELLPL